MVRLSNIFLVSFGSKVSPLCIVRFTEVLRLYPPVYGQSHSLLYCADEGVMMA